MVFQTPTLAPVTVQHNVEMVLKGKNYAPMLQNVLKLAQIDHLANQRATKLSGGEQQRVSLARAFASERKVLLMDEPFHSLDYGLKRKLHQTFTDLLVQYDRTVVLVTHDIDEALLLGDRIFLLQGRPCELREVATIDTPRAERNEYSAETIELRKQLQQLLL